MTATNRVMTVIIGAARFEIARPFSAHSDANAREVDRITDALIGGEGARMVIDAVGRQATVMTIPMAFLSEPWKVRELVITCLQGIDENWVEH